VTVSALARSARLPRATANRLVESLVSEALLARLADDRIVIGIGLHAITRHATLETVVLDAAHAPLARLATQTSETITLTITQPDGTLAVIRQIDGRHLLGLTNWVGRPVALHATSAGKLALAAADEPARLLGTAPLVRYAHATITDPDTLAAELDTIRRRGWSEIADEYEDGLAAVSVAFRFAGAFAGAVNISGPTTRLDSAARRAAVPALRVAAQRIEQQIDTPDSPAGLQAR
jgi:DNA-binding IclR family transcriptional regulator